MKNLKVGLRLSKINRKKKLLLKKLITRKKKKNRNKNRSKQNQLIKSSNLNSNLIEI